MGKMSVSDQDSFVVDMENLSHVGDREGNSNAKSSVRIFISFFHTWNLMFFLFFNNILKTCMKLNLEIQIRFCSYYLKIQMPKSLYQ